MAAGVIGGIVAGILVAALQHVTTTPLILTAEIYEAAQQIKQHVADVAGPSTNPLGRTMATSASTMALSTGYALVLLATMLASGDRITSRNAALWGACAFAATGLAPSLGLAPQLPGAAETDLAGRQLWWVATAVATGAGLYLMLRIENRLALASGFFLLMAPHFFTPTPASPESTVPAELAAQFAAASLVVQAVSWVLAGTLAGLTYCALTGEERDASA